MRRIIMIGVIYICLLFMVMGVVSVIRHSNMQEVATRQEEDEDNTKQTHKILEIKGEISDDISPFIYDTESDEYLLGLCYGTLYNGESEDGWCLCDSVDKKYDNKKNTTTYTIRLKSDIKTASGTAVTADDLMFNYYLRLDVDYSGSDKVAQVPIKGVASYQSGISDNSKLEKIISKELKTPSASIKKLITTQIIKPALSDRYKWVDSLYEKASYDYITDKYPKKSELFVYFFAQNMSYLAKGKTKSAVINDIAAQYHGDYKKLARLTGDNYNYWVRRLIISQIALHPEEYIGKNFKNKDKVQNISGISKIDDRTIEIVVSGKATSKYDKMLLNIYIVPLAQYRCEDIYDGSTRFGFNKGSASSVTGTAGMRGETGRYRIIDKEKDTYILQEKE